MSHWVGVHGVDVVCLIVHHDNLRISSGCSRGSVSPNIFRGNLSVFGDEMILEAGLIIVVGLPDHALHLRVGISEVPIGVIIYIELGLGVFNQSISIVDAGADSEVD